ncbi:MAG: hypothetical protein IJ943_09235 [Akkermansia sp.]|nr:hypothetical protein [Akkermansia sp.]
MARASSKSTTTTRAAQVQRQALEQKTNAPRKRGSKSASVVDNNSARPEEIQKAIHNAYQYFNREIVKSDEECADRLNAYFRDCHEQQMIPTVECMSLALGTVRRTVWDWEQGIGCSAARTNMIKKAKQILAAIDADLVSAGKIPQVVYIFRAKNFFGMSDQQEITINAAGNTDQDLSADDIARRYLEDGKTVETGFSDGGDE